MAMLVIHVAGALFAGLISFVLLGRHEHASSIRYLPLFIALGYVMVIAFMKASQHTNWQLLKASLVTVLILAIALEIIGHVWFVGLVKYDGLAVHVAGMIVFVLTSVLVLFSGFVVCKLLLKVPPKSG